MIVYFAAALIWRVFWVGFMHSRGDFSVIFGVYSALGCDILLYPMEYGGCLIQSALELYGTIILNEIPYLAGRFFKTNQLPMIRTIFGRLALSGRWARDPADKSSRTCFF